MACGDAKAGFRIALLDPGLTLSQPPGVTATAGFDAMAHAVETFVTTRSNPISDSFSREAWRLLEGNFERVLKNPNDLEGRSAMQLGAHYAGVAIENSMLGATHACANRSQRTADDLGAHCDVAGCCCPMERRVGRFSLCRICKLDGHHPPAQNRRKFWRKDWKATQPLGCLAIKGARRSREVTRAC
jgi:hypothetical protein